MGVCVCRSDDIYCPAFAITTTANNTKSLRLGKNRGKNCLILLRVIVLGKSKYDPRNQNAVVPICIQFIAEICRQTKTLAKQNIYIHLQIEMSIHIIDM